MPGCFHSALRRVSILFLLGLGACEPDPAALFLRGDYLAARAHYNPTRCAELPADTPEAKECHARAQEVQEAVDSAVRFLGMRANTLTAARKQIQFNAYGDAIVSLEVALELMSPDDPHRPVYEEGLRRIGVSMASLEQELVDQCDKLENLLDEAEYPPEVWRDIRRTFERLRVLQLALRRFEGRPAALALRYVEHLSEQGQFERARIAAQVALAVDERSYAPEDTRKVVRAELLRFAFIDFRARRQERQRQKQIRELLVELNAAINAEQSVLAATKARAALMLDPEPAIAARLRGVLGTLEGRTKQERVEMAKVTVAPALEPIPLEPELPPEPVAVNVVQPGPRMLATAVGAPVPEEQEHTIAAVVPAAPEAPAGPNPSEVRRLEERLSALLERFEAGEEMEAIVSLEGLVQTLEEPTLRNRALRLRELWDPDRQRLVRDIVADADRLFVQMDDGSLARYRQALQLSPEGPLLKHVNERIATLERILRE